MYTVPLWVILSSNIIIAAGTVYGGWGIIETMGVGITNLTCSSGFASNVGAVTAIFGATQLGIPISTTHAAAASIAGAGYADKSPVRLQVTVLLPIYILPSLVKARMQQVVKDMAIAWLLTLPASALIAYFLAKLVAFTNPVVAYACCIVSIAGIIVVVLRCVRILHGRSNSFGMVLHNLRTVRSAGLLVWARLVMASAKGREDVEAAVENQNASQEIAEMPDVRLLAAAQRSEEGMGG